MFLGCSNAFDLSSAVVELGAGTGWSLLDQFMKAQVESLFMLFIRFKEDVLFNRLK